MATWWAKQAALAFGGAVMSLSPDASAWGVLQSQGAFADVGPRPAAPTKPNPSPPKPGKGIRGADLSARRAIAGGPTADDASAGAESPDLRALREAERDLFPPASPAPGGRWPSNLALVLPGDHGPAVLTTGVPPTAPISSSSLAELEPATLAWLSHLEMPDLPVRWDERVLRFISYFRDDPVGHATFTNLYKRSGRWRDMIRRTLRQLSLPEDLAFVAMIESGFDVTARSPSGAMGLWQFMPETAKIYGLSVGRWVDDRLSAERSTAAAALFLGDLHRRFGSWELALAGFNMGYVGLASVVRRFNTNDFWSLARTEGTLPWETTLYVPKVFAAAVIAHNLTAFGFSESVLDAPLETDEVEVPAGTSLALVAEAAGVPPHEVELLNPELHASRTPPAAEGPASTVVRVPRGKGASGAQNLARLRKDQPPLERYVVRFGESLDEIAAARKTTVSKLVELNALAPGEAVRGGTVVLVPHADSPHDGVGPAAKLADPSVVVPADVFVYPDRKRVFYRVLVGDTLKEVAAALHVTADELRRWNDIDAGARLQEGMTLQAFVAPDIDTSNVLVALEDGVRVLPVGSDEFFAAMEHDKSFKRVAVPAKAGDTLETIGKRFDVSPRAMERINRRPRADVLKAGETVVVYLPSGRTTRPEVH